MIISAYGEALVAKNRDPVRIERNGIEPLRRTRQVEPIEDASYVLHRMATDVYETSGGQRLNELITGEGEGVIFYHVSPKIIIVPVDELVYRLIAEQ